MFLSRFIVVFVVHLGHFAPAFLVVKNVREPEPRRSGPSEAGTRCIRDAPDTRRLPEANLLYRKGSSVRLPAGLFFARIVSFML